MGNSHVTIKLGDAEYRVAPCGFGKRGDKLEEIRDGLIAAKSQREALPLWAELLRTALVDTPAEVVQGLIDSEAFNVSHRDALMEAVFAGVKKNHDTAT